MKTVKSFSPKTKILSLVLSFLIIFYIVPTSVFAEGLDNDTTVADNTASKNEGNTAYAPEIYEVTDLREENVKHFRLADGSYVAAQYNYPVHYTDDNGQLVDIDNRFVESGSELSTENARIKFVKKITGNGNIFTLHENNSKITMGLVGAEKRTEGVVTGTNNSDDAIESALGKMTNLENISSTIIYEDILDGVDIEYIVHSLNIKENIIVKEKKDNYSYTFTIELNNLIAKLADNGNVYINSFEGETQYIIPAPVVYDANGTHAPHNMSAYVLSMTDNGKYRLNVTVASSWMNDDARAFPVTIDPPMMSTSGGALDFNIDSTSPNANTDGNESFYVSSTQRSYIKFDESSFADIPVGSSIMKAELSILGNSWFSSIAKVGAYAITTDWGSDLTWNKTLGTTPQGSFSNVALDYIVLSAGSTRRSWDITELYKSWLNGAPNYGVGLRLVDETSGETAALTACEYYPSSDDGNFYAPVMMVTYIYNDGLEDYYPMSTHSAGVGGVGSINLSTGRLTLAIPTLTTTDSLFSFTPTLVYNSSFAGKSDTSAHTPSALSTSYMPHGFKLNVQETIVLKSYRDDNDISHNYYVLYDADGSTHRFYRNGYSGPYYDDDGLQLSLNVETNVITIEDIDHNVKTYAKINDSSWYLSRIKDKFGNELTFIINTAYQHVKVYVKPNGQENILMLDIVYDGDKICAIYNDSSKDSVIFGYSGNNLSTVKYCYGNANTTKQNVKDAYNNPSTAQNVTVYATATYTYDSNGYITEITDSDTNTSLRYEITDGKVTKLSEYAGTTLGQQVSYSYGEGYTDVRSTGNNETLNDEDDIISRYIFDEHGRSVSAHSYYVDSEQIIGATMNTYENEGKAKNSIKESAVTYDGKATYLSNAYENYDKTLQGGIDKTSENGCFKKTVFEEENPADITYSNANMEYVISGFGYSNSIIQNNNAKFSLSVNVYYYQGENEEDVVVTHHYDFLDVEDTWQFVSGKLDCQISSTGSSIYDVVRKIEVVYNYYGQIDTNGAAPYAQFKDVSFTDFSEINSYRYIYDVNTGNLVMKSSSGYKEYYEYNDKNSITRIANNKGRLYDYEYASDGITLTREIYYKFNRQGSFPGNLLYDYPYGENNIEDKIYKTRINQIGYVYTDQGLLSRSQSYCEASVTAGIITLSYTYDETEGSKIFGALLTETDELGYTTKYFYDSTNGELLAQINLDTGNGYVYNYTDWGVLEGVMPATGTASTYNEVTNAEKVDYEYDLNTNRLTQISTDSTVYSFSYDAFGNSSGVTAGNNTLATYEYYPNNGKIKKINYGNGFSEEYEYNSLELLDKIWYNYNDGTRVLAYSYTYNNDGTLHVFTNHLDGTSIEYEYDVYGRFISASETSSSDPNYRNEYEVNDYDADGRVTSTTNTINYLYNSVYTPLSVGYQYTYNNDGTLKEERILSSAVPTTIIDYYYDSFNRTTKVDRRIDGFRYTTDYTYYLKSNNTNELVSEVTNTINGASTTYNYTYDSNGNITKIVQGSSETTYTYDDLDQLTREHSGRITRNYTYDNAGNITSIQVVKLSSGGDQILYAVKPGLPTITTTTATLSYTDSQWGDLLTSYDGHTITYDAIGNPLSYYNGSAYTFTWEGRRLVGTVKGSNTMSFTYNDEGIRTSKTVNGVTHTYQLNGSQIVSEEWGDKLLIYLYDASGSPIGMMFRKTTYAEGQWDIYWFEKNLQGDIVAVYNNSGDKVAWYTYSTAWGTHSVGYINLSSNEGVQYNPFRYRGYYYDTDLGLYYLQSRYYDSNTCRFISPDTTAVLTATTMALTDKNLYAYCDNNPVNRVDGDGEFWGSAVAIGALVGFVVGVAGQFVSDLVTSSFSGELTFSNWQTYVGAAVGGAIGGAVLGGTGSVALSNAASGFFTTGIGSILEKATGTSDKSWLEIGATAVVDGAISYGLGLLPGLDKITQGRNSMSAVYKSGLTKLRNDTVSKMSMKVATKGIASVFVGSLAMDYYYGLKQFGYERINTLINNYAR